MGGIGVAASFDQPTGRLNEDGNKYFRNYDG